PEQPGIALDVEIQHAEPERQALVPVSRTAAPSPSPRETRCSWPGARAAHTAINGESRSSALTPSRTPNSARIARASA
ncbi:hypothetical protein ACS0Y6_36690, partial [Burkholderia gladioli]|uniref:hypothetical protein n=1 Tax=Burkholderia gladioli TaxID=28095 RepID=UPI003F794AA9